MMTLRRAEHKNGRHFATYFKPEMCGAMSLLLSHPKIFHSRPAHAKRNVMDSDATAPLDIFWDGVWEGDTNFVGDVFRCFSGTN